MRGCGGIGRRTGFRFQRSQGRGSSSLPIRTNIFKHLWPILIGRAFYLQWFLQWSYQTFCS